MFDTYVPFPNVTAQISLFEGVLDDDTYTRCEIERSMALISVAGNDYFTWYEGNNKSIEVSSFVFFFQISFSPPRDLGASRNSNTTKLRILCHYPSILGIPGNLLIC